MTDKFEYTVETNDGITTITLTGVIDEDATLGEVFADLGEAVVIDLGGVERINSCGIRTWVNLIGGVSQEKPVSFRNCPPALVRQFNMITNFGRGGQVGSFTLPYYCAACDKEVDITVDTEGYLKEHSDLLAPEYTCSECKGELEFDDIEEKFFHFLSRWK